MSIFDELPRDSAEAQRVLTMLAEKDQNRKVCSYPTCDQPRRPHSGIGQPPGFCENPDHHAVNNYRARQRLARIASDSKADRSKEADAAKVDVLRSAVLQRITQLTTDLERYTEILVEITDPDLALIQMQTVRDQAAAQIAEASQRVSMANERRLLAEEASQAHQRHAQAANEAAELAMLTAENAEARLAQIQEDHEQTLSAMQAACENTVAQGQAEAQRQIALVESQTADALAQMGRELAQTQTECEHLREEQRANELIVATTSHDLTEALAERDRERSEVQRLRQELTEERTQSAAERSDLLALLTQERADGRLLWQREHQENQRLREELQQAHAHLVDRDHRADTLANQVDTLRTQLVQMAQQRPPSP